MIGQSELNLVDFVIVDSSFEGETIKVQLKIDDMLVGETVEYRVKNLFAQNSVTLNIYENQDQQIIGEFKVIKE